MAVMPLVRFGTDEYIASRPTPEFAMVEYLMMGEEW
jgi:hypothetical protein